ncbi:MAG: hypothetical protein HC847_06395 [Hydrococcus sp. RU_2_2]|jgi:hypothetical protein|nr:hypothetical protein [Hydrococcus sp. RU_2_2]
MLREDLKKELDKLNDEQLQKIADFITSLELQSEQITQSTPFWQRTTSTERSREFREWVSQLPKDSPSLSDEAFSRDTIYAE